MEKDFRFPYVKRRVDLVGTPGGQYIFTQTQEELFASFAYVARILKGRLVE